MRHSNNGESLNDKRALRALEFREAFLAQVTSDDVAEIATALVKRAKEGDLSAAKLIFDRLLGNQPVPEWESRSHTEMLASFS